MARPKLTSLLMETQGEQATSQAEPATPAPAAKAEAPTPTPAKPDQSQRETKPPRPANAGPRYLDLVRKETRLGEVQYQDLTVLSRRLNKARQGSGERERITENTLIRIAVDLLLKSEAQLAGVNEDELRKSVGL